LRGETAQKTKLFNGLADMLLQMKLNALCVSAVQVEMAAIQLLSGLPAHSAEHAQGHRQFLSEAIAPEADRPFHRQGLRK
jgi:hypothetical protein